MKSRLLVLVPLMLVLSGCSITTADIIAALRLAVPPLIDNALLRAEIDSPDTAKTVATQIANVTTNDLLPLVAATQSGTTLLSQIQARLETAVGSAWGTTIAGVVGTIFASVNLDNATMSADEKSEITAGLTALVSGCNTFLAGDMATFRGVINRAKFREMLKGRCEAKRDPACNGRASAIVAVKPEALTNFTPAPHTKGAVAYREAREQPREIPVRSAVFAVAEIRETCIQAPPREVDPPRAEIMPLPFRTMVVYSAPSRCIYCRRMSPILHDIVTEHSNISVIDPDTTAHPRIDGVPCFIIYDDGREVSRHYGAYLKDAVLEWLK